MVSTVTTVQNYHFQLEDPVERPPEPTVPDERVDTTSEEEDEDNNQVTQIQQNHQGPFTYDVRKFIGFWPPAPIITVPLTQPISTGLPAYSDTIGSREKCRCSEGLSNQRFLVYGDLNFD